MVIFKNPSNGYTEEIGGSTWFWCLLFGCFYFAYKGIWPHFIIGIALAVLTAGLSWLVYPFFAKGIVEKSYKQKGWVLN